MRGTRPGLRWAHSLTHRPQCAERNQFVSLSTSSAFNPREGGRGREGRPPLTVKAREGNRARPPNRARPRPPARAHHPTAVSPGPRCRGRSGGRALSLPPAAFAPTPCPSARSLHSRGPTHGAALCAHAGAHQSARPNPSRHLADWTAPTPLTRGWSRLPPCATNHGPTPGACALACIWPAVKFL